jgi:hypothetical protein
VPAFAPEDAVEASLRVALTCRGRVIPTVAVEFAQVRRAACSNVLDGAGMCALLVSDFTQQPVGIRVSGGASVQVADFVVLGGLTSREQPLHRCDPGLHASPQRHLHRARVRNRDPELCHSLLQPAAVASLGLGHLAQNRRVALVHTVRYELIHGAREDLAPPRLQQPIACFAGRPRAGALRLSLTRHLHPRLPGVAESELKAR